MAERVDEKVFIPGPNGTKLCALIKPAVDAGENRIIVMLHGHAGHKDYTYQKALAAKCPLASIRFDFRANGESTGDISVARTMEEDVKDVRCITDYCRQQGYVTWAVVGHSRGGMTAVLYSLTDSSIKRVVLCSTRFEAWRIREKFDISSPGWRQSGIIPEKIRRTKTWTQDRIMPASEIESIAVTDMNCITQLGKDVDVLSVMGSSDDVVSVASAAQYANILGERHTLEIVPFADHMFYIANKAGGPRQSAFEDVAERITNWFSEAEEHKRFLKKTRSIYSIERWNSNVYGVSNFREVGGFATNTPKGFVRNQLIFRSANLTNITPEGIDTLHKLGIGAVFDLRSNAEIEKSSFAKIPGVHRYHVPIFSDEEYSPEKLAERFLMYTGGTEGFLNAYQSILENSHRSYPIIFRYLLDFPDRGIIIHCTAGKDRTGVCVALLLGLLGCSKETIAQEYNLSVEGMLSEKNRILKIFPGVDTMDEESKKKVMQALDSDFKVMFRFLDIVDRIYGSVENYFRNKLAFSDDEIERLRKACVISGPELSEMVTKGTMFHRSAL